VTHPHGDRQAAVDVGFLEPALLHDAAPLGAHRRRVLTHTHTHTHTQMEEIDHDGLDRAGSFRLIQELVWIAAHCFALNSISCRSYTQTTPRYPFKHGDILTLFITFSSTSV